MWNTPRRYVHSLFIHLWTVRRQTPQHAADLHERAAPNVDQRKIGNFSLTET